MAAHKKIDYARIEPDWRAGIKSPAQLAAEYTEATGVSVSHAAIIKHFKKLGVPRDLSAKIRAKADAMVMEAMVTGKVSSETTITDLKIIADSAMTVANIRIAHRADIYRSRQLVMMLLTELEEVTTQRDEYHQLAEVLRDPEVDRQRLEAAFDKAMSLPTRTKTAKDLSDALKTLIGLEREAYSIVSEPAKIELTGKDGAPIMQTVDPIEAARMYQDLMK